MHLFSCLFCSKKQSFLYFLEQLNNNFNKTVLLILVFISFENGYSQTVKNTLNSTAHDEIKGTLLDLDSQIALPYANIIISQKKKGGTITNEDGQFLLDITKLNDRDTISFQYIGYETKKLTIKQLDSSSVVYLKEDINSLDEIFVFSKDLDAASIVKKVLENREANYKKTNIKNKTFIRNRSISDLNKIKFDFKKSSLKELSEERIRMIEKKIPKHTVSFTDFLGDLYFSDSKADSLALKIDPIKMVSLKDKNLADMDQLEVMFEKILSNTKENEYWKVKSGLLSSKIEMDKNMDKSEKDSLKRINQRKFKTKYFKNTVNYLVKFSSFSNKKEWGFLYNTNRYEYTLAGGTVVNGEDVYIIDFVPKSKGKFKGRMFIALNTYALIRADYAYAEGKTGMSIHLFGVGYAMDGFNGSISFEKKFGTYQLKYCSKKEHTRFSIDRKLSLIKKRERFLMDKTLNEIKVKLKLIVSEEVSSEMLVLDHENISKQQFLNFRQKEYMKLIYVDQFDEHTWKDYSIIEPTKQMREYKKTE